MSADFYSSYVSGALGIVIGNRLDIIKTELQAGNRIFTSPVVSSHDVSALNRFRSLFRGAAAPVLGYGALNSILFVTYNRVLGALEPSISDPTKLAGAGLGNIWIAGAVGGLACWVVSAPSELIKCRTQLCVDGQNNSWFTAKAVLRERGVRGLYLGGAITSVRDSFGYAWYFWTYELSKRLLLSRGPDPFAEPRTSDVLIAGGIAGVATWASIFPLDLVKTRLQTQNSGMGDTNTPLLGERSSNGTSKSSWQIVKDIARTEGLRGFYRGLMVCSLRAFIVNAAQFVIYENCMRLLTKVPENGVS